MARSWIKDAINKTGEQVTLAGWVWNRRDHGKLIFIDLIDTGGAILQVVFAPGANGLPPGAETLRINDVIEINGKMAERPSKMVNLNLETGKVEFQAEELKILNKANPAPFDITDSGYEINEETRLKYRYLDLRRIRLLKNLKERHKTIDFMRNFLKERGFTEVETPMLTKSTPEGARDFVVPSRLHKGKFYALPQAPQQFKQLLMVAGLERYFQVAKCIRDEDTRADRQPEFTQLDIEMSFADREAVMKLNEEMIIETARSLFPEKRIKEMPFPRISYKEAMERYGTDRPDLRTDKNNPNELAFCWVIDFPFFEKTENKEWTFTHNPFSAAMPEWHDSLMSKKDIGEIIAAQYDIVLNGFEIGGGSVRNHRPEALKKVFEILGYNDKQIQENFGHMLEAFSYGAPPHAGIAYGMDRLITILLNEPNIREVIAFPKTGDGRDLMMSAPSEIMAGQLKELGIAIVKPKTTKAKTTKKVKSKKPSKKRK
ncbi:MAG: aspartate--tRNA ligase [Candidatus Pacebacteria bacterium]|nr:aspartate--tRNA ligase [Candidatus Paceibacterota bacterium]